MKVIQSVEIEVTFKMTSISVNGIALNFHRKFLLRGNRTENV